MYINKQTTVKAGFNPNSIKNFIDVKTALKTSSTRINEGERGGWGDSSILML